MRQLVRASQTVYPAFAAFGGSEGKQANDMREPALLNAPLSIIHLKENTGPFTVKGLG